MNNLTLDSTKEISPEDLEKTYDFLHAVGSDAIEAVQETRAYKLAQGTVNAMKETALFFYDLIRGDQPIPPGTITQERLLNIPEPQVRVHPMNKRTNQNCVPCKKERIMPILERTGWANETVRIHRESSLTYRVVELMVDAGIEVPQRRA